MTASLAGTDLAELAARFAARLRGAGLAAGPERSARFAAAVTLTHPVTVSDLYWCGLTTLVADPADIAGFDRVFAEVFGGPTDPAHGRPEVNPPSVTAGAEPAPGAEQPARPAVALPDLRGGQAGVAARGTTAREPRTQSPFPALAARAERLGGRDFATLSGDELAALVELMRRLRLLTPLRRSRRFTPGSRGRRVDLRLSLRRAQRTAGYPVTLARHRLRSRRRRLVVLCDISGSMEPYARAMLQLLYCAATSGPRAEVFAFATRLTRLTRTLARVRPDLALEQAGRAAPDWSGGTRIGEAVKAFLDRYGNRGLARGAVVLIISDGWETGDSALLAEHLARLARLAYRIVWANPRTASPRYQPLVSGMAAAWPFCDAVVSAHSLSALDALVDALATSR
ncbi:MAG TPA: VWA domain-containing protein [Micromonosporaceae bacterium]